MRNVQSLPEVKTPSLVYLPLIIIRADCAAVARNNYRCVVCADVDADKTANLNRIKAEGQTIKNLIKGGNCNLTTNWTSNGSAGALSVKDGALFHQITSVQSYAGIAQTIPNVTAGDKIFVSFYITSFRTAIADVYLGGAAVETAEHPGAQPRPFMRPSFDGKSQEAIVAIGERIKKRLTKQGFDARDIDIEVEV